MKQKGLKNIFSFALAMLIAVTVLLASTGCGDERDNGGDNQVAAAAKSETLSATDADSGETDSAVANGTSADESGLTEAEDVGEGETVFRFEATDDNGDISAWNVHTDEKTVGAALAAVGLIDGEESQLGLYVTEVDGLTADYDTDGAYWAFYINGEMAVTGADGANIEEDGVYAFIYTKD